MTEQPTAEEPTVRLLRQWNGWDSARYWLADLEHPHWSDGTGRVTDNPTHGRAGAVVLASSFVAPGSLTTCDVARLADAGSRLAGQDGSTGS